MKTITAKEAKNGFGRLIDNALAEPIAVAKHGRPVVVVLSIEEYERLKKPNDGGQDTSPVQKGRLHVG